MARAGVEPATFRFSGGRSYQLSYLAAAHANPDEGAFSQFRPRFGGLGAVYRMPSGQVEPCRTGCAGLSGVCKRDGGIDPHDPPNAQGARGDTDHERKADEPDAVSDDRLMVTGNKGASPKASRSAVPPANRLTTAPSEQQRRQQPPGRHAIAL